MPCAIQNSSNKNMNLEEGSKYFSLGGIPFWPVNPIATSIKTICPNKFHNYFSLLPLLALPCVVVQMFVSMWRHYISARICLQNLIFPIGVHPQRERERPYAWCTSSIGRRNVTDTPLSFIPFKALHEWPVHQPPSSCDSLRRTLWLFLRTLH